MIVGLVRSFSPLVTFDTCADLRIKRPRTRSARQKRSVRPNVWRQRRRRRRRWRVRRRLQRHKLQKNKILRV
jgi:hypothetical protein